MSRAGATIPPPAERITTPEIPPPSRGIFAPRMRKIAKHKPFKLMPESGVTKRNAKYWNDAVRLGLQQVPAEQCHDTRPPPEKI